MAMAPSLPVPPAAVKRAWTRSIAAWGCSVLSASFSSSVPSSRHDVARDQDERVACRHLAAPDVRREVVRGQHAVGVGVGERQQVRLVDEVGLHGAHRRHVELAAAHHRDTQPDGAGGVAEAQAIAARGELPVGGPDRLLQAGDQPRRLVVVVLALHRVRDEPRGLLEAPGAPNSGDDDIEAPLGPRRRPDRRLDDGDRVRGVLQAFRLGDHAELHLQSDGHRLTRRWRGGRRDAGRPVRAACGRLVWPRATGSYPGPPRPVAARPGCRPVVRRTPRGAPPPGFAAPARRRPTPPRPPASRVPLPAPGGTRRPRPAPARRPPPPRRLPRAPSAAAP